MKKLVLGLFLLLSAYSYGQQTIGSNGQDLLIKGKPKLVTTPTTTTADSNSLYTQKQINALIAGAGSVTPSSATTFTNKNLTSGTNTFPTFNQNTTGGAGFLTTARLIQGVSFNGTADINPINGTGFVKVTGTTLSYDNSTYLTASTALSTTLTGLSTSTVASINSSDSFLTAFGKLQASISLLNTATTPPIQCATTGALPAYTWNSVNVAAVYTANANGALSIDGYAVQLGDAVLVKNESTHSNNGVFILTQLGDSTHPWVLTRRAFEQTVSNISVATLWFVEFGTSNSAINFRFTNTAFNGYNPGNGASNYFFEVTTYIGAANSFTANQTLNDDIYIILGTGQSPNNSSLRYNSSTGAVELSVYHTFQVRRPTGSNGTVLDVYDNQSSPAGDMFWVRSSAATFLGVDRYGHTFTKGLSYSITSKTANYTATNTDYYIKCTANSFNVTFPGANSFAGQTYVIANTGSGTITAVPNGSDTITGTTTIAAGASGMFASDGSSNWTRIF